MSEVLLQKILSEITGIKDDISGLKEDMSELKKDVSELRLDVDQLKVEQQKTNDRLTAIETKQNLIYNPTGNLTTFHTETMSRIDQLQTDIEFTYQKTALHDLQINRLENISPQDNH